MKSFLHDDSGNNNMPTVPPRQQHQHPAQTPMASSQEYGQYSVSPGPYNPSTAAIILPAGQQQQHGLQQRPLQQNPSAASVYTLTPANPVNIGGFPGAQSPLTSMQHQQHHHVVPSPSRHSSLSELNNPSTIQLHERLLAAGAAPGVPGLVITAPIVVSPAHRRPSVLNSGHCTSSALLLARRLHPVFVDTTPPVSIVSPPSPHQQQRGTTPVRSFVTHPTLAHRAPAQVAAYAVSSNSPAGYGSDNIRSPFQQPQQKQPPYPPAPIHGRVPPTAPDPTSAHATFSLASSLSRSQQQQQQLHLLSVGASGAAPEALVSFATAPLLLPSPREAAAPTTVTTTSLSALVDLDDVRQGYERPFRFKTLPPPPTFESFLMLSETNAFDQGFSRATARGEEVTNSNSVTQQQEIACAGSHKSGGAAPATGRGNMEAVLRASTNPRGEPRRSPSDFVSLSAAEDNDGASDGAAQCKAAAAINEPDNKRMSSESRHSTPEWFAMVAQYHHVLERWWTYMVIFENKPEVRQRLGNLHQCPSFADAQQAVAAAAAASSSPVGGGCGTLDGGATDPLVAEEVVLQAWSTLALQWWEETKQRRRPRRSHRRAPCGGLPPTRMDDEGVGGSRSGNETGETASLASVNPYELLSAEEGHLTRSLPPDHDALLHFDFTIQSALSSPTDS
ncbi:hypothetical protein Q4I30_000466 [Leishmania utingensis]|uniref:Uncharacterized protein n=1 Tax=Leishmania utingensis TaxID=653362 RepID=A0AAW3B142_9TRYP